MQKYLLILFSLSCITAKSQSAQDSVKTAINQLFTAMKNADAAALKACFTDSAILQSVSVDNTGKLSIKNEPVHDFADVIGKLPKNAADERIQFDMVKTDGPLATAWTPYSFYFNGKFSHCGVDSYQLVRIDRIWKIQYLIDTRRKDGCE